MDIIKPNSSYPSLHDGLHIYSGTTSSYSDLIVIKTDLRQTFYAKFHTTGASGSESTYPFYDSMIKDIGYVESIDSSTGSLNYTLKNESGRTISYLIIGSQEVRDAQHKEITVGSGSLTYEQNIELDAIIEVDGSSSLMKNNSIDSISVTSRKGTGGDATGVYFLETLVPFFSTTKTVFSLCMENNLNTDGTYELRGVVASPTSFIITCFINDNEGSSNILVANPPDRIHVRLKTYY